jgi:hypothetical protein
MEINCKRFLVFKKVEDLFEELATNKKLETTDENALLIPIEVIFKKRNCELNVEIPLQQ